MVGVEASGHGLAGGDWLTGDHSYRIHLPKDVPANMFWSLTVYDNETRSMIQNDHGRPLVGSVHGAVPNQDGSFDLYFGPSQPAAVRARTALLRQDLGTRRCGETGLKYSNRIRPGD